MPGGSAAAAAGWELVHSVDAAAAPLARFAECAHNHVVDTHFSSKPMNGQLTTKYRFEIEAMEGSGKDTLFAL